MDTLQRALAIGALGAVGSLLRYALGDMIARAGYGPPWLPTLVINVAGCFLIGLVDRLALSGLVAPGVRLVIVIGFLGAFTTFSTYARELVTLGAARDFAGLALQFLAQNLLGVLAVLAGMAAATAWKG